jgi:hypothetical protein
VADGTVLLGGEVGGAELLGGGGGAELLGGTELQSQLVGVTGALLVPGGGGGGGGELE